MSDLKPLLHLRALPHAALALAAFGSTGAALAQTGNAAAGAVLYVQRVNFPVSGLLNCENCHSTGPLFRMGRFPTATEATVLSRINAAIGGNSGGMTVYSTLTAQQRADIAAFIVSGTAAPPPPPFAPPPGTPAPPPAPVPAPPMASPNPLLFNSIPVGSTSAPFGVLFTNSTTSTVSFANPSVTSTSGNTTDFLNVAPPAGTTACPSAGGTLGPGMSCSFGVQFAPTAAGARSAVWTVSFTGGVAARMLTVTGTASAVSSPAPAPAPAPAPSAANAPTDGGGGAFGWLTLFGLMGFLACGTLRPRRETDAWPHSDS